MLKRVFVVGLGLVMLGSQAAIAAPGRAPLASPNVNITRLGGNQSEAAIAIDPTDPSNVVEFSNRERGAGMVLAHSADGGATWDASTFAQDDRFGRACCDPTLSWDGYGNLFMAWLDLEDSGAIPVALSTDGGPDVPHDQGPPSEPADRASRRRCRRHRRRQGRGGRGRGREAGRRREGARAEPEGLVRRSADDRDGRRIRLAHVEQQRHPAGDWRECVRIGAGRDVLQASRHPEEPELQLRRYRDRPAGSGLRGLHEGQGGNTADGRHHPRRHGPGRVGSGRVHARQAHRDDQRAAVRRHHAAAFAHGRRRDRPGVGHGSHEPARRAPLPAVDRRAAEREQRHGHLAPLLGRRRRHVERTRPGQRRGDERPVPPAHRARSHDREPGVRLARRP